MPPYNTNTNPFNNVQTGAPGPAYIPVFTPGVPVVLWNQAVVPVGNSSQQFAMHRHEKLPECLALTISFASNPGNFQLDFETSDVDTDASYVTKTSITQAGLSSSFVARMEVTDVVAKYGRVNLVSLANAVAVTVTIY